MAAGVAWTSRTTSAPGPWAAREGHTPAIDAAGAIYVIGGFGYYNGAYTYFNDVWVSTDGGADRTRACQRGVRYCRYSRVLALPAGTCMFPQG